MPADVDDYDVVCVFCYVMLFCCVLGMVVVYVYI